jgi:hypothetical protein
MKEYRKLVLVEHFSDKNFKKMITVADDNLEKFTAKLIFIG